MHNTSDCVAADKPMNSFGKPVGSFPGVLSRQMSYRRMPWIGLIFQPIPQHFGIFLIKFKRFLDTRL